MRWIIVAGNYKYKNMKKSTLRFIFTVILIGTSITSYSQYRYSGISDIEKHGDWYRVYSETGKEIKSMYAPSVGELVGSASNFFIMRRGDWYDLYNVNCKKYKTLYAPSIGTVVSVNNNGFVVKHDNWVNTYDWTGKKLNSRYSR